jgi:hypothetical protein
MNGSDDEQHDAHVKCYRIAVAVADGDAVEAAYDKQLAKAGSTDERDAAYRAYVERVSRPWKDAPPLPLSFCLRRSNPGAAPARSRPRNRVPTETPSDPPPRHDRGRPQNPDALNPPAHPLDRYWGTT